VNHKRFKSPNLSPDRHLGLVAAVAVVRHVFIARVGLAPAAAGLIAYNGLMAWGLIVFVLGIIIALLLFAMWHAWRDRPWTFRLAAFTVGSTILYSTHPVAFFCYGVLVASYETLGREKPWKTPARDWIVLVGQAVPALIQWEIFAQHMTLDHSDVVWGYSLPATIEAALFPFLFRGAAGGLGLGVLTAVVCEYTSAVGITRRLLSMPRTLFAPALVMAGLSLCAPFILYGESLFNLRFPVVSACLFLAGLQLAPTLPARTVAIAALIGLLTAAQVADVSILTHQCDLQYAEARDAFAALPRGARVTTVISDRSPGSDRACTTLPIYEHMAQLVTLDRSGDSSSFFGRLTSVSPRGALPADERPETPETFVAPSDGFVFWVRLGGALPSPTGLSLVRRGSFFDLWATKGSELAAPAAIDPVLLK
jgi:hypothetical protein